MRSKRFEALAKRPVNQDGFVKEWIEEGFIAMESPNDPKPSIRIVNGAVTEPDGKPVEQFDLIDHFIARYGINLARAEEVMAMDSVKLANMLCDPNVKRSDIVPLTTAMTPAKIVEVVSHMNVVEMMMAMQKCAPAARRPSRRMSLISKIIRYRLPPTPLKAHGAALTSRRPPSPWRATRRSTPSPCWSVHRWAAPASSPSVRWKKPPS